MIPYWLVDLLVCTGLLDCISPVFRLATTSHSEIMSQITQNKDLQALSAYFFYGTEQTHTHTHTHSHILNHIIIEVIFNNTHFVIFFAGVPPKESSFLINALLIHHYKRGAYYPRGGASEIAFNIIPVIEQAGGKVLVRAPVQRILLNQQGEACGEDVRLAPYSQSLLPLLTCSVAPVLPPVMCC